MYEQNEIKKPVLTSLFIKRALLGAMIGLAVILFFVLRVDQPHPSWPNLWWIRPIIITPLAGAAAGVIYHFIDPMRFTETWQKILAIIAAVIVYIVGLWMGVVLGLDGTMWN